MKIDFNSAGAPKAQTGRGFVELVDLTNEGSSENRNIMFMRSPSGIVSNYEVLKMDALKQAIESMPRNKPVQSLEWNGERYWVKFCGENKQTLLRAAASKLATVPRLRVLSVNAAMSTEQRFLHECEMLGSMHQKQLPVVEPVLMTGQYLATRDMGTTLRHLPADAKPDVLLGQAFAALAQLHRHNMCHGRPALRDIVVSDCGQVKFLDLEEAQRDCSAQLMARDTLLLLMESFRYKNMKPSQRLAALKGWAGQVSGVIIAELARLARWLRAGQLIPKAILLFKNNFTSRQLLGAHDCLQDFFAEQQSRHCSVVNVPISSLNYHSTIQND